MSNLKNFKTLQHILKSAKFDVKGDAILMMASAFSWFDKQEKIFAEMDKKEEMKIEPIEKPIKNEKSNVNK